VTGGRRHQPEGDGRAADAAEVNKAKLEKALADYRACRKEEPKPAPEGSEERMREHWDTGFIMEIDGVVEFDSEAERTGTPSPALLRGRPRRRAGGRKSAAERRKRYYSGTSQRK
jgi:hypothetical protein